MQSAVCLDFVSLLSISIITGCSPFFANMSILPYSANTFFSLYKFKLWKNRTKIIRYFFLHLLSLKCLASSLLHGKTLSVLMQSDRYTMASLPYIGTNSMIIFLKFYQFIYVIDDFHFGYFDKKVLKFLHLL